MDKIRIKGGHPISGTIAISGAKNAALPLMAASLLAQGKTVLNLIPHLADIDSMILLFKDLGVDVERLNDQRLVIDCGHIRSYKADYDLVRKMRASILVLGPLVARFGQACVSLPGGCAIGARPVDLHIKGLQALGANIEIKDGYIYATTPKRLIGTKVALPLVSVGATENIMMAACLAEGTTVIENAAREPEIVDLACFLQKMGAEISGAGTSTLTIKGVPSLKPCQYQVMTDRIEAGTYMIAALITGGTLTLTNAPAQTLEALMTTLRQAGADISIHQHNLTIKPSKTLTGVDVMTEPYPGFPTDLQAQFMALMTVANGASMITETIFENRFMHVPELARMGANITIHGSSALVRGVNKLSGAPVMATDLRASVSLVLAGLVAKGETIVNRIYHLDRGYENLVEKLNRCGAVIDRIKN
ncbi:MAG: UDP-N-acetylglucosamine 1-carboxyvinyltransferase [Alphaproteobacteria bacterium]|nr:UDP-N-acetylglucosamine 1-carboxyvinyltransferase [Alphaproteobacteria bacterium]